MNNKIVFEDNNQTDSNAELLKENTPQTVDYNQLYNIKAENKNGSIDNNQEQNNINNEIPQEVKKEEIELNDNKKKKGINSLLFVFILFIIIMGFVIFLFPWLGKFILG